jgi:hypothetical protein
MTGAAQTHLDLVDVRPVSKLIEANLADPAAGSLVDSRPRAEPVYAPLVGVRWLRRTSRFGPGSGFPPLTTGSLKRR